MLIMSDWNNATLSQCFPLSSAEAGWSWICAKHMRMRLSQQHYCQKILHTQTSEHAQEQMHKIVIDTQIRDILFLQAHRPKSVLSAQTETRPPLTLTLTSIPSLHPPFLITLPRLLQPDGGHTAQNAVQVQESAVSNQWDINQHHSLLSFLQTLLSLHPCRPHYASLCL